MNELSASKSIPTMYKGVSFRSRLEARYAAFFDLAGWDWSYEAIDKDGWIPDFLVRFKCACGHCNGRHLLIAEVKWYHSINDFRSHFCYQFKAHNGESYAAMGNNPSISAWKSRNDSTGFYTIPAILPKWEDMWKTAGNTVQYSGLSVVPSSNLCMEVIDPIKAKKYLERNIANRPPNKLKIQQYADDMLKNHWTESETNICFDTNGNLLNGQHRLMACILSGVKFTSSVRRNMDSSAFKNMDTGLPRSMAMRTGIPKKEVEIYKAAIQIATGKQVVTAGDIDDATPAKLIDATKELHSYCGTSKGIFSRVPVRLAACTLIALDPDHKEYIKSQYRSLVLFNHLEMADCVRSFHKQWMERSTRRQAKILIDEYAARHKLLAEAMKALHPDHAADRTFRTSQGDFESARTLIRLMMGEIQKSMRLYSNKPDNQNALPL